jgi:HK97 family phage portal protein
MAFLRNLFSRKTETKAQPASRSADPLAFYLNGNGKLSTLKSNGLIDTNYMRTVGLSHLYHNAEMYAKAAIASVWAANCINLRADTMARLDFHVRHKYTKDIIPEHPFTIALDNSERNIMRLFEKRLLTFGEVFIKPLSSDYQRPGALWALNNLDVDVDTSRGYIDGFWYTPNGVSQTHYYKPRGKGGGRFKEIAYIHTDNDFDDFRGLSKFEHVLLEIHIDRDISRTTAAFYQNDARPGLLLIPDGTPTPDQMEQFVASWNMQFKGPSKSGRTGFAPTILKDVKEFQRPPTVDDVELRESVRREICAAFKVPLSMAGAWDDATYQSLPEQRQFFYEETIIPAAEQNARDLTKHVLPFFDSNTDHEIYFDATSILALVENVVEKTDVVIKKVQAGLSTVNEGREALDMDKIKGGDIFIMQSGWIPVPQDELSTFEAPNTAQPYPEPPAPPQLPEGQPAQQLTRTVYLTPPETEHKHDHTHGHSTFVPDTDVIETIEVKTVHGEALDEIGQWRKFHKNGTAQKRDFTAYMIRDDIAAALRENLDAAGQDMDAIKAAFDIAEIASAIKAIEAVRSNFELEVKTLIDGARLGTLKRIDFTNRLKSVIRTLGGDAFRAGLTDGGVITNKGEELNTEDAAVFESMVTEQSSYVVGLSAAVYKEKLSDAQIQLKPRQWWGKSMQPFYDSGLLSANRNGMVEIVGTIDKNSCNTCKALVGQRHRRRSIMAAGLMPPYGSAIQCSDGGLCKHRAISTNSRPRGRLSRVPRK